MGAISPYGVVNISARLPYKLLQSKKGKTPDDSKNLKSGMVSGHYFNFVSSTLDVTDKHEEFKGHYLIMNVIHPFLHIMPYENLLKVVAMDVFTFHLRLF